MKLKTRVKSLSLLFVLAFAVFSFGFSSAQESCNPTISLVNQDPNPSFPDSHVTVLFEVSNLSGCDNGYSVRLNPEYPFSADTNQSLVYTIGSNPYAKGAKSSWMVTYKLKVDKDALDGDYSLKLQAKEGGDGLFDGEYTSYQEWGFDVAIQDSRTAFDAVIQDYSSSQVSIAIANVGKYTANSVVVRIPEQSDYSVTGTDGQMVGNIDSGDYTIVGFEISSKSTQSAQQGKFNPRNVTDQGIPVAPTTNTTSKLQFDVYYTDNLGERRVVNMELPLKMSSNSSMTSFAGRNSQSSSSWYSSWYIWVLVIILASAFFYYRKNKEKVLALLNHEKKVVSSGIPEWMMKAKGKEKK